MGRGPRFKRTRVKSIAFLSAVVAIVGIAAVLDLTEKSRLGAVTMVVPTEPVAVVTDVRAPEGGSNVVQSVATSAPSVSAQPMQRSQVAAQADSVDVLKVVRDESGERIVAGELLVAYDTVQLSADGKSVDDVVEVMRGLGFELRDVIVSDVAEGDAVTVDPLVTYVTPDGMLVSEAVVLAEQQEYVAYAEPNYVYSVDETALPARSTGEASLATTLSAAAVSSSTDPLTTVSDPAARSYSGISGAIYGSANQWWLCSAADEGNTIYRATLAANGWSPTYKGANVVGAWDYARTNGDVTIAIIDTGARLDHPDLRDNIIKSLAYDAYYSTNTTTIMLGNERAIIQDESGHGTHVAGIAAGTANNGIGIAGSSYNAKLIPVRAGDANGNLSMSAIARAFSWVANSCMTNPKVAGNVKVINCSFGTYSSVSSCRTMLDWITTMRAKGVLTVCAGGNGKSGVALTSHSYPSDYSDALSVTSLEFDGTNSVWSDYNSSKNISAPGEYIYSTLASGSYGIMSGTSMAAPLVSGLAALCWAYDPSLTVSEVVEAITSSADPVIDTVYNRSKSSASAGAVNARNMIKSLARKLGSFAVVAEKDSVNVGETLQFGAQLKTAVPVHWIWKSSDERIASFEGSILKAQADGRVEVWAEASIGGETVSLDRMAITVVGTAAPQPAAPDAPANPSATSDRVGVVNVSWSASSSKDVSGYRLWRAVHDSLSFELIAELPASVLTYADATAGTATSYDYVISAVSPVGESERTESVSGYALTDLSNAIISTMSGLMYTGAVQEPKPTVTVSGVTLVEGQDFTYNWANNVDAAAKSDKNPPTVIVKGIGYYTGTASEAFEIAKADQELGFASPSVNKTYGDPSFQQVAARGIGDGQIKYSTSDAGVVAVDEASGYVTVTGAGNAIITVTASETKNCRSASSSYRVSVAKAVLTATYAGGTIELGAVPPNTVTVTGFVRGETDATATGYLAPTVNTSSATTAGTYTLTPAGGSAKNYTFVYKSGTLKVTEPKQSGNISSAKNTKVLAYRLYDANTRDTIYVATISERNLLRQLGWKFSGLYLVPSSYVQEVSIAQIGVLAGPELPSLLEWMPIGEVG